MRTAGWTRALFIALFVCVLAGALTFVNLRFTRSNAGGNDFLPRWLGTRLFLTERQSPFSAETTAAIQAAMYGRGAEGDEDQALFVYPIYTMIFFAPFSLIGDYALARALWITMLEMALMGTALAAIAVSGWKPGRWALAAFLFFALAWFHGAKPLVDGNASILVALMVTLALLALRKNQDGLAGILLGLATIKPQIVALIIPFVLLWSISKKRRGVMWGFLATMAALIGISFAMQPDWLAPNIAQVMIYETYVPPGTPVGVFTEWWGARARMIGLIVSGVFALAVLYEWWRGLRTDFDLFLWAACLTIVLGPLTGLFSTTSNYSIFLPVLAFIFSVWQRRIHSQRAAWVNIGLLFVGIWAVFLLTLQNGQGQYREHLILLYVAPIWLAMNLYWLRGWLMRPAKAA